MLSLHEYKHPVWSTRSQRCISVELCSSSPLFAFPHKLSITVHDRMSYQHLMSVMAEIGMKHEQPTLYTVTVGSYILCLHWPGSVLIGLGVVKIECKQGRTMPNYWTMLGPTNRTSWVGLVSFSCAVSENVSLTMLTVSKVSSVQPVDVQTMQILEKCFLQVHTLDWFFLQTKMDSNWIDKNVHCLNQHLGWWRYAGNFTIAEMSG